VTPPTRRWPRRTARSCTSGSPGGWSNAARAWWSWTRSPATHLEQAFGYRCGLGPADEEARLLAADAAAHLEAADRRAMDRGDAGAVVNLLERAEALLPAQQLNLRLQEGLIRGLGESARFDDAIARAARIADACAAAGDRVGELRAQLAGAIWQLSIDPDHWLAKLRALVEEARPAIEQDGNDPALATLEHAAGEIDFTRCQNGAALAAYTRAMQHARQAGEPWFEASIRVTAAAAMVTGPTPRVEALRWLEDAEAQSAVFQPMLVLMRAACLAELGRFDEARPLLTETLAQMNERGMRLQLAMSMVVVWIIEMLAATTLLRSAPPGRAARSWSDSANAPTCPPRQARSPRPSTRWAVTAKPSSGHCVAWN